MQVSVGSGKTRKTVTLPSFAAARGNDNMKIDLEKGIEAVKAFLFRPALLKGKKN